MTYITKSGKNQQFALLVGPDCDKNDASRQHAAVRHPAAQSAVQSPVPGSGEKYFSYFSGTPSHSFASAGGSFLDVMFGQRAAYSVLIWSHLSRPGSVSGLIASAGHSGSHTPQSMHSSGWMTSMLSPS